jgi:hypothetical protein
MSNGNTNYTTGLSVTFSLGSTAASTPYNITGCSGTITTQSGPVNFTGFVAENLGTPDPNGATFALMVTDLDYAAQNSATGIANWAVTFIPRGDDTTVSSPTSNSKNTITGSGYTNNANGTFTLFSGNTNAIKYTGTWDWSLMIQITLPNNVVKCFASDPEMEVGV